MCRLPALLLFTLFLAASGASSAAVDAPFPAGSAALERTVSMPELAAFLASVHGKGAVSVSTEGVSSRGFPLFLVRLARPGSKPRWRLLIYAQQHGDEVAGKDALLYLIREAAEDGGVIPKDVELWVMPSLNPDGAAAGTRRNAADEDLNRDHLVLKQSETRALHAVALRLRPHVAVDCHEFDRDDYADRGWAPWPSITMDNLNNPLFDPALIAMGRRWVEEAGLASEAAGHPFLRYWLGGAPPDEEIRHSAPDVDSAMNALAMHGGLSFIIESALSRGKETPEESLRRRVSAYRTLFKHFLAALAGREADRLSIEKSWSASKFFTDIPVNYFWANTGGKGARFPVLDLSTGKRLEVATRNLMSDMVVKKNTPAPAGYIIDAAAAPLFQELLTRQAVPFEQIASAKVFRTEASKLARVETERDELYGRYGGRQIVERLPPADREFPAGSLLVPLSGPSSARAALILEPTQLYGLYAYESYKNLVSNGGVCPVWRVMSPVNPLPTQ